MNIDFPENGVFNSRELSIDMKDVCNTMSNVCTACHREMWMVMFLSPNFIRDYNPATMTRVYKTCQHCRDRSYRYRYGIPPPQVERPLIELPPVEQPQAPDPVDNVFVLHV